MRMGVDTLEACTRFSKKNCKKRKKEGREEGRGEGRRREKKGKLRVQSLGPPQEAGYLSIFNWTHSRCQGKHPPPASS